MQHDPCHGHQWYYISGENCDTRDSVDQIGFYDYFIQAYIESCIRHV